MLEGADGDHPVEWAERLRRDILPVQEMRFEAVTPARLSLLGGERQSDTVATALADGLQHRSPAAANIEDSGAWPAVQRIEYKAMLFRLRLLESLGEVSVVQRTRD